MGYKIGDRVRSLALYPETSRDHVPSGTVGVIVGRGNAWPWRVAWDGSRAVDLVSEYEIEPAETRTERIIRTVQETGRPFVGVVRSQHGHVWPAFVLANGRAYPFEDLTLAEVADVARRPYREGYMALHGWTLVGD